MRLRSDSAGGRLRGFLVKHPNRLRMLMSLLVLGAWYAGVYLPLSERIDASTAKVRADRERYELARKVDELRKNADRVRSRLPKDDDQNGWMPFLMAEVRAKSVKLVSLVPRNPITVGPYTIVSFRLTVEGDYADLEKLLRSLEANPRLVRIESLRLTPKIEVTTTKGADPRTKVEMQLTVLGIIG